MTFSHCTPEMTSHSRVDEIYMWLSDWNKDPNSQKIENWVAIDDADMSYDNRMAKHFVLTDAAVGITRERADLCISLLNSVS